MSSGVRSPVTPLLFELPPRPTLQTEYRHHAVNDIIACTFRSIGVPAVLEPPGLLKGLLFPAVYYYPAVVFTACLRDVTRIGSASSWARLFFFAGSLRCPDRGGRRVNLSARVLAQLELFDSGQSPQPISFIKRRGTQSRRGESVVEDDERVAKRASIKLDLGEVGGAVRVPHQIGVQRPKFWPTTINTKY